MDMAKLREALQAEQNVRLAPLFGSTAVGTDTSASDVDVLVDLHDGSLEYVADLNIKRLFEMARKVEGRRRRHDIAEHLEQFPRQHAALERAMAAVA